MPASKKRTSPASGSRVGRNAETPVKPILLRKLHLRCGDWSVKELRVNRHLQPFDLGIPHHHSHGQLLLYLRGHGEQRIGKRRHPVAPGAVFFIPPRVEHAFLEHSPRLAICLVADLSGDGPVRFGTATGWLPAEELAHVRERLNQLAHERLEKGEHGKGNNPLELGAGGTALQVLDSCRRVCSGAPRSDGEGSLVSRRLLRSIRPGEAVPSPGELARRVGLQQDYLNRLVRRSTGLTLGQWRARELLKACERELSKVGTIGVAALRLGFSDPNYFSRWFRRQTGMTPGSWRACNHISPGRKKP